MRVYARVLVRVSRHVLVRAFRRVFCVCEKVLTSMMQSDSNALMKNYAHMSKFVDSNIIRKIYFTGDAVQPIHAHSALQRYKRCFCNSQRTHIDQ